MGQLLKPNQIVRLEDSNTECRVQKFLGGGGQGEVYRARVAGKDIALKWYFPHYLASAPRLRKRLTEAIDKGPPTDKFLWPLQLAAADDAAGFGYVMPLREQRFKGLHDHMRRRIHPTFHALATAGYNACRSYFELHTRGMCYRDINYGNLFIEPKSGDVLICDNDNVDIDGQPGEIGGTPKFMAPELVCGTATPSTQTDLHSLAVLLFYFFMIHHPLDGERESQIDVLDLPAMRELYGTRPVFIWDPDDASNRPNPRYHPNAIAFWKIYPTFLKDLFVKAFTLGLRNSQQRVRETEWMSVLVSLRDSVTFCPNPDCQREQFFDPAPQAANRCWRDNTRLALFYIQLPRGKFVVLNRETKLYPHHITSNKYDFSQPVAEVNQHPQRPSVWGLKNLTADTWSYTTLRGGLQVLEPQESVRLKAGTKINFGAVEGEIKKAVGR